MEGEISSSSRRGIITRCTRKRGHKREEQIEEKIMKKRTRRMIIWRKIRKATKKEKEEYKENQESGSLAEKKKEQKWETKIKKIQENKKEKKEKDNKKDGCPAMNQKTEKHDESGIWKREEGGD